MNNYLSITRSNVFFLKNIFRVGGFLGIFSLGGNSVIQNVSSKCFIIFNIFGIIFTPLDLKASIITHKLKIEETIIFAISHFILISMNVLCIYGIFKNKHFWKELFDILDKFSKGILTKTKSTHDMLKLICILWLVVFIEFTQIWYIRNRELTITSTLTLFLWISTYVDSFIITLAIWTLSKIVTARYFILQNLIQTAFSENSFKTTIGKRLKKIQINLFLLNRAVLLINSIMGKMIFALLAATFFNILAFFNFIIFYLKFGYGTEFFPIIIIAVLLCFELVVSMSHFYFFVKHIRYIYTFKNYVSEIIEKIFQEVPMLLNYIK